MDRNQFQKIITDLAIGGLEPSQQKNHFSALIDGFDKIYDENNEHKRMYNETLATYEAQKGELENIKEKYHNEIVLGKGDGKPTPIPEDPKTYTEEDVINELINKTNEEGA